MVWPPPATSPSMVSPPPATSPSCSSSSSSSTHLRRKVNCLLDGLSVKKILNGGGSLSKEFIRDAARQFPHATIFSAYDLGLAGAKWFGVNLISFVMYSGLDGLEVASLINQHLQTFQKS